MPRLTWDTGMICLASSGETPGSRTAYTASEEAQGDVNKLNLQFLVKRNSIKTNGTDTGRPTDQILSRLRISVNKCTVADRRARDSGGISPRASLRHRCFGAKAQAYP